MHATAGRPLICVSVIFVGLFVAFSGRVNRLLIVHRLSIETLKSKNNRISRCRDRSRVLLWKLSLTCEHRASISTSSVTNLSMLKTDKGIADRKDSPVPTLMHTVCKSRSVIRIEFYILWEFFSEILENQSMSLHPRSH